MLQVCDTIEIKSLQKLNLTTYYAPNR